MVRNEHIDKLCVAFGLPEAAPFYNHSYLSAHGYRFLKCPLRPYLPLLPLHIPLTQLPAQIQTAMCAGIQVR